MPPLLRMSSESRASEEHETSAVPHATTSSPHSLSKAVHARKAEYTRAKKIRVKIGSWNVAACPGTDRDLRGWFVEGKGIEKSLVGQEIANAITQDQSQENVESVDDQEARRTKKESTIPRGDEGTIAGGEDIGLYVLGLQEVVGLTSAKEYIGRVYTDTGPITKWRRALMDALPSGYELIAEQQLSGLLLFIFASPTVALTISSVSTVSVGTGIMGYLGNKGAVTTRIVLGETTRMVFINSHLASGTDPALLDRRCWDVSQILSRTHFDQISWAGVLDDTHEGIGEEDFAFWFGDLNFRLDGLPGEDIRRLLMLHTKGEYGADAKSRKKMDNEVENPDTIVVHHIDSEDDSSENESEPRSGSTFDHLDDSSPNSLPDPDDFVQDPHTDPASLQATLDSLLPHDQLLHVQKTRKAFHDGWREGPITFLPTYKYDVGSVGMFDSSEKKRAPSWCDRILFRTRRDKLEYDRKTREEEEARVKDEEMKARGIDHASDEEDVLFDYDPDTDGSEETPTTAEFEDYDESADADESHPQEVVTKEGFVDKISLDVYTSHQRVLSSDHKPLDAVFTLEYDAVIPELKSQIQAEVAKELDRAENEGRPGITIVVDHTQDADDGLKNGNSASKRPDTDSAEWVNFGEVGFQRRKTRHLTIANTSQVAAQFTFVSRPTPSGFDLVSPEWLKVVFAGTGNDDDDPEQKHDKHPEMQVTLEPGDTINVNLEAFVDDITMVRSLNDGMLQLEDILVLRVTDGRDHFIPVKGTWLQSCFGRSVDELIRVPEGGVRALLPDSMGKYVNRGQAVCWSSPRELIKLTELVESLTERCTADESMVDGVQLPRDSVGWPFDSKTWLLKDLKAREWRRSFVLDALDSDKNLNESFPLETPVIERLEIMADVLVMFLGSITDGIVPETLWVKLEDERAAKDVKAAAVDAEEKKAWILDVLSASPNHNISFVFLTSMLSRVAAELAPVSRKTFAASIASSTRSSMDSVRRSLSWRGKPPPLPSDPAVVRRQAIDTRYAEIFAPVVIRAPIPAKDKDRRAMEDRRRDVLEVFLRGREYS